jgi:hypothetical protein
MEWIIWLAIAAVVLLVIFSVLTFISYCAILTALSKADINDGLLLGDPNDKNEL